MVVRQVARPDVSGMNPPRSLRLSNQTLEGYGFMPTSFACIHCFIKVVLVSGRNTLHSRIE